MSWKISLLCCICSSYSTSTWAQGVISLPELIQQLRKSNPEVEAARYRFQAAAKRPLQVGTLPDPKISVTNFGVGHPFSILNRSNFAYQGIGVSQEIPYPGKRALASEQARKEAQSEEQMLETTLREATSRLKVAYFEWASIAKQIEIAKRDQDLLRSFEEIARSRYSVGKGMQQDVLKAQVELSSLAEELELLQRKQASAEAGIQYLLGREAEAPLGNPSPLKRSIFSGAIPELLSSIQENSSRVRAQQFLIESRGLSVERRKKDFKPDLEVSFQWEHTGSAFPDYYMATASIQVPLYRRKLRYAVQEAESRRSEGAENYRSARLQAAYMVKDEYLTVKSSERLLDLYESGTIPQATLALESTTSAYQVGNIDFLSLLSSLKSVLGFEKQYYEELARHEQALARLEPLVGRELTQP